jgi:hypothetical protein
MGEDHVVTVPSFFEQMIAQSPDPRPRVNDNDLILMGSDFYTGRISPVLNIFLSANRD